MLVAAFRALALQLIVIAIMVAVCATLVLIVQGPDAAIALLTTSVVGMKCPWVWTFGFGLATFIKRQGGSFAEALNGVLVPNEVTAAAVIRIQASTRQRSALPYTIPLTALGVFLTFVYGIPNYGLSYILIFTAVCLIYYISGFLLHHFIEVVLSFNHVLDNMHRVEFKYCYNPLHLENLTTYLAITTTIGLIAIYAGFRGTLTAGFQFHDDIWRTFLITPLVLFLPGTLFYDFYPRYVLRKIVQYKVFRAMEQVGDLLQPDARCLIAELRESSILNSQILPFIDYKSVPSYMIASGFVISIAYNNDPAVKSFVQHLLHLG